MDLFFFPSFSFLFSFPGFFFFCLLRSLFSYYDTASRLRHQRGVENTERGERGGGRKMKQTLRDVE